MRDPSEVACHRTVTPNGAWQWMDGPPSLGALDNLKVHPAWRIEYASPTPQPASADVDGVALIAAERQRQVSVEGWTPEHDAEHGDGEMAQAAACYALPPNYRVFVEDEFAPQDWPWDRKWWKPQDRVHDLTRAGALIAAEIDRLLATGARQ